MNLTEPQMRALASVKRYGYAVGKHGGKHHLNLERGGLITRSDGRYSLTDAGSKALLAAIVDAEHRAARALGEANAAREAGRPSVGRYDASAQKWLDLANDLQGDGHGGGR